MCSTVIMANGNLVSNDRQARELEVTLDDIDQALSSEQVLRSLVQGLPQEVIEGVRRTLATERREIAALLLAYQNAKNGDFALLKEQAGNDPGAFLIAARIARNLTQKELARKLGLKEQAIQRWEAEKYRTISLQNYQKVAQALGVTWRMQEGKPLTEQWGLSYDVARADLNKVLRHARANGWFEGNITSDDNASATLFRYINDHVTRYGTPSLLRTGLTVVGHNDDWSVLSWKAEVTRRAEKVIELVKPRYRPVEVSWLVDLVQLSRLNDGPRLAQELLLEHGIILVAESQIAGMKIDGAAFLADEIPVIGMTLRTNTLDNFWFTLLHEVAHVILHYRTGLSAGFFDEDASAPSEEIDGLEAEANQFARNLLIPEHIWSRSPARIAKSPEPIERLAEKLKIHPAIIFGRIRMERKNYAIFSNKLGRGLAGSQLLKNAEKEHA
jgi:HTH-type transcriptional regulator/antitoxin HigA